MTRTSRKLDRQTLAFEVAAMECWHDITRIHCIFVFDETKSIHDFDIRDFASSMRAEVIFDILLRSSTWKIAQVEAGARHFAHCAGDPPRRGGKRRG